MCVCVGGVCGECCVCVYEDVGMGVFWVKRVWYYEGDRGMGDSK